jgi:hypothetical protein
MAHEYDSPEVRHAIALMVWRSGIERFPAGISLGGCVTAHGTDRVGAMRRSAHAHTGRSDYRGWLCFKSTKPERLVTATGRPTMLFAHEWAHVAVLAGHTRSWRALMTRLGHPSEAKRYERAK